MNERDFEFSVVTTPKQIEKIDNSAFWNVIVFVKLFLRLMVNYEKLMNALV
jgi:septin family protein